MTEVKPDNIVSLSWLVNARGRYIGELQQIESMNTVQQCANAMKAACDVLSNLDLDATIIAKVHGGMRDALSVLYRNNIIKY